MTPHGATLEPTLDWPEACAARVAALAAEDRYSAEVWEPAERAGGNFDAIDAELNRLVDVRCQAEETMIAAPAPDLAAAIEKIEFSRTRWIEFEDWPEEWWNAVLADLRRLSAKPA